MLEVAALRKFPLTALYGAAGDGGPYRSVRFLHRLKVLHF